MFWGFFVFFNIFFFFFGFWFDSQFKNHQCGVTCMNFHIHTVIRWFDLFSVRHAASHRSYNSAPCWLLISHHLLHLQSKRFVFKTVTIFCSRPWGFCFPPWFILKIYILQYKVWQEFYSSTPHRSLRRSRDSNQARSLETFPDNNQCCFQKLTPL